MLLAHDLGTSGDKATLFTSEGRLVASRTHAYPTSYTNANWAEQDPEDWWQAVCQTTRALLAEVDARQLACVCFSGQMMGCLCVDARGRPLRNSLIYSDQRSVAQIGRLIEAVGEDIVYRTTGHRASASYSLGKLMWVRDHEPEVYRNTYKMLLAKDFINFRLTGRFCTEQNDASGTNAYDINSHDWSESILEAAGIEAGKFPEVLESVAVVGKVTREAAEATGLPAGLPVVAGAGDGGCATVGVGSVQEGVTYNYLGSSSWISTTTRKPIYDRSLRTFTWCHPVPGFYQPCGTMQTAGSSYSWLKENLCQSEVERAGREGTSPYELINAEISKSPPGARGILFLPYLLGERSPRWNPKAKGAWIGLKLENRREDLFRAVLEGVGLNLQIILSAMAPFVPIKEIILIGGGAKGALWRQMLADIFRLPVLVPEYLEEATSMGAAIIGGVGCGLYPDFRAAQDFVRIRERVQPEEPTAEVYDALKPVFEKCYSALEPVFECL